MLYLVNVGYQMATSDIKPTTIKVLLNIRKLFIFFRVAPMASSLRGHEVRLIFFLPFDKWLSISVND